MSNKAKVFLPIKSDKYDSNSAVTFGERKFIFTEYQNPYDLEDLFKRSLEFLEKEGFDPLKDYICMSGPMIFTSVLMSAVIHRWHIARVLIFNNKAQRYVDRFVNLEPITNTDDSKS